MRTLRPRQSSKPNPIKKLQNNKGISRVKIFLVALVCLLLGGCIGGGQWGASAGWPSGGRLMNAAADAAKDPQTWVPLVAAGALIAADVDHQWTEDMWRNQDLFGSDAESVSDDLRDVATGAYVLTALLAPSDSLADKAKGLAVGAGTMIVDGVLNRGLKELTNRERPDGSNDYSMPSGHASQAASRTNMAIRNLRQIDMPDWARTAATWSLHGVAVGTGLARVEGGKHHLSDIFVGYALGQFVANFMQQAFMPEEGPGVQVSFVPVPDGGALTVTIPLH